MAAIASPRRSAAHRRLTAECPSTSDFFFFFSLFFGWKFHFISFHSSFFFVNDFSRTSDAAGTEKAVGRNGKKKETSGKPNNKKKCKRTRDSIFLFFCRFPYELQRTAELVTAIFNWLSFEAPDDAEGTSCISSDDLELTPCDCFELRTGCTRFPYNTHQCNHRWIRSIDNPTRNKVVCPTCQEMALASIGGAGRRNAISLAAPAERGHHCTKMMKYP